MACGVSFQQIQKYEAAVSRLSAAKLWEISNALGVEVSYFFDGLLPANGVRLDRTPQRQGPTARP